MSEKWKCTFSNFLYCIKEEMKLSPTWDLKKDRNNISVPVLVLWWPIHKRSEIKPQKNRLYISCNRRSISILFLGGPQNILYTYNRSSHDCDDIVGFRMAQKGFTKVSNLFYLRKQIFPFIHRWFIISSRMQTKKSSMFSQVPVLVRFLIKCFKSVSLDDLQLQLEVFKQRAKIFCLF